MRCDVTTSTRRHLLFATDNQLELLCGAQRWYMDATFWVVRKPFTQMFSIHAFITNNGNKTRRLAYCAYRMLLLSQHFINSAACCSYVALSLYRHCIMSGPNVYCKLNALWHFDCRIVASDVKQMPLLFALMSGKSRKDYRAVSTAAYIQ